MLSSRGEVLLVQFLAPFLRVSQVKGPGVFLLGDVHVEANVVGLHDVPWAGIQLDGGVLYVLLNTHQTHSKSGNIYRST